MAIPVYKASKIDRSNDNIMIGEDPLLDFEGFLSSMVEANVIDNSTQLGIFKLALDKGTSEVSEKQFYVLREKVEQYDLICQSSQCTKELTWSEVDVYNDESYCSDCSYTRSRIQSEIDKDK